jgi:hypothetical protein
MMNQEDLLKKTGNILKELQDQYDFLAQNPQQLSELELELFLANAHFLTDHVQILKKVTSTVKVHELPEHTEVNPKEIHAQSPVNVYDELFKPDIETPTFEFTIHDQLKDTSTHPVESSFAEPAPKLQPEEEEEIVSSQDDNIIEQSNPIAQPITTVPTSDSRLSDERNFTEPETVRYNLEEEETAFPVTEPHLKAQPQTEREPEAQSEPQAQSHYYAQTQQEAQFQQHAPSEQQPEKQVQPEHQAEFHAPVQPDEDEIGPEPFLVTREAEPVQQPTTPYIKPEEPATAVKHQPNLNELLASKSPVVNINLSESGRPVITDLKSAINLNEKLLFIKDLFDGYNLAYAEAIDLLNKMPDFNTADKFLKANYAAKHQWSTKPATVEQFYELLHQRFPK